MTTAIRETKGLITLRADSKEHGFQLNGRVWTRSSRQGYWKEGVFYCDARGTKLCTLDETVKFTHDSKGTDHSPYATQLTSTLIGIVRDGRAGMRAHLCEPSPEQLVAIAQGYGECEHYRDVATNSDLGRYVLEFSKDTSRTFVLPTSDLRLRVIADEEGRRECCDDPIIQAFLPRNSVKFADLILRRYSHLKTSRNGETNLLDVYRPRIPPKTMRVML